MANRSVLPSCGANSIKPKTSSRARYEINTTCFATRANESFAASSVFVYEDSDEDSMNEDYVDDEFGPERENPLEEWRDFATYNPITKTEEEVDVDDLPTAEDIVSDHEWPEPAEPTPNLLENGLSVPHTCVFCRHIVINSRTLVRGQKIPLCEDRAEMVAASEYGCPFFRWLEWRYYRRFALDTLTRNKFNFALVLRSTPEKPYGLRINKFGIRYWTLEEDGRYGVASDDNFHVVAEKGTLSFICPT